jgi:hypothetical protein
MEDKQTAELIKQTWLEVFPNGHAELRKILGSYSVSLYLKQEWTNGIKENDPLTYFLRIEGENAKEFKLHCLTIPPEGSNLVYESKAMRKQTIKQITREKLIKRFTKIKEWLKTLDIKEPVNL